jgi:hypothetical protein
MFFLWKLECRKRIEESEERMKIYNKKDKNEEEEEEEEEKEVNDGIIICCNLIYNTEGFW